MAGFCGPFGNRWNIFFRRRGSALAGIALATPAFTLAFVLSGFFKGLRRPAAASLLENGGIALGVVPFLFLLRGLHPEGELATLGWAYALALAAWPLWRWHGSLAAAPAATGTLETPRVFFATSQAFFFTNLAVLLQSVVGIMLAGWLLASAELGLFKAAQQLASAVSFVLVGINAIFPPLFAESYHQGRPERLAEKEGIGKVANWDTYALLKDRDSSAGCFAGHSDGGAFVVGAAIVSRRRSGPAWRRLRRRRAAVAGDRRGPAGQCGLRIRGFCSQYDRP